MIPIKQSEFYGMWKKVLNLAHVCSEACYFRPRPINNDVDTQNHLYQWSFPKSYCHGNPRFLHVLGLWPVYWGPKTVKPFIFHNFGVQRWQLPFVTNHPTFFDILDFFLLAITLQNPRQDLRWYIPSKTNMTVDNPPFENDWKWQFSNVMLVFRGVFSFGDSQLGCLRWDEKDVESNDPKNHNWRVQNAPSACDAWKRVISYEQILLAHLFITVLFAATPNKKSW